MNTRLKLFPAALTVTLLAACLGKQPLDITYYSLTVPAVGQPVADPKFGSVFVRDFYLNPNYEDKNFNYRTGDLTYETDFYHQFKLSPRAQLTSLTRDTLRNSGLFKTVLMPESSQVSDYALVADVSQFYADFRNPQNPRATLTINFNLSHNPKKGLERPILFSKTYSESIPIAKKTADNVATSWNTAYAGIMNQLLQDLTALTPPPSVEPDGNATK
ncbi:MAG: hypothetical protein LBD30_05245 [Verrucomicrobiales bacterium]|jgi:ABC-type uncharacterized transport system auxiliary subunit|nr:hypothetical protein [Verrucomicrobiales bacterium]